MVVISEEFFNCPFLLALSAFKKQTTAKMLIGTSEFLQTTGSIFQKLNSNLCI